MKKFPLLAILFLMLIGFDGQAQYRRRSGYRNYNYADGWSLTAKAGIGKLFGELDAGGGNLLYGVAASKGIIDYLNIRLELEGGILTGNQPNYYNSRFRTEFYQANVLGILNIGRIISDELPVNIGLYMGLGFIRFNATAYNLTTGAIQRQSNDEWSRHTPIFQQWGNGSGNMGVYYTRERTYPFGLLLTYPISPRINIGADVRYNLVRNDKLDATSGTDRSDLSTNGGLNKLWGQLSYSDTPNDRWASFSINVSYKFGSSYQEYQRGI